MDYSKSSGILYEKYGEASFICDTHELYYKKDKETNRNEIILYHRGLKAPINIGYTGKSEDNTIRKTFGSNECICFYDTDQNGQTIIKYIFYIPSATFINGDEKMLEEMFMMFFGTPFNTDEEIPKPMVRHITLNNTSQEN